MKIKALPFRKTHFRSLKHVKQFKRVTLPLLVHITRAFREYSKLDPTEQKVFITRCYNYFLYTLRFYLSIIPIETRENFALPLT